MKRKKVAGYSTERLEDVKHVLSGGHLLQAVAPKTEARYTLLRNRLDNLYADKLDGTITEDFYAEKRSVWGTELLEVEAQIAALRRAEGRYYDVGLKFLELAQKLHGYWQLQQDRGQRGEVIKALLSNCSIKDGTLSPTYRKPFDIIVEGLKSEEWGESAYGVRTESEDVWSLFLHEFKRWCASEFMGTHDSFGVRPRRVCRGAWIGGVRD